MYEPRRTLAFQRTDKGMWKLEKLIGKEIWIISLNDGAWVVTARKDDAFETFNNLVER